MKTGYFETLANNSIKCLDDGTKIFFPQGPMGRRGYLIPSNELELKLRKSLTFFYLFLIIGCGMLGGLAGPSFPKMSFSSFLVFCAVAGLLGWAAPYLYFWRFIRHMKVTQIKNSPVTHWKKMSDTMGWGLLLTLTSICLLFSLVSLLIYAKSSEPICLLSGIMFGAFLIPYTLAIRQKLQT